MQQMRNAHFWEKNGSYLVTTRNQFTKDDRLSIQSVFGVFFRSLCLPRVELVKNVSASATKRRAPHLLHSQSRIELEELQLEEVWDSIFYKYRHR
jgi:hypothetical protein